jgi:ferrous iron transport protein A
MRKLLSGVKSGKKVKVVDFIVPPHHGVPQYIIRLQEMGILKGDIMTIERNGEFGPVEVEIKGTHLAIGRGIASKIVVEEIDNG